MTLLALCGSPRKGGNSEVLLDAALSPFKEQDWTIRRILLSEKSIAPCTGCETCTQNRRCAIQDGMSEIYEAYAACDALIIAAPAYFRNVPAQLKAVFDRTFAVLAENSLRGKPGGAIAVGRGSAGGGQAIVINIIYNFYLSCGALCVPGELNGVTATADGPGEIRTQPRRLAQARALGENLLHISTCLNKGGMTHGM